MATALIKVYRNRVSFMPDFLLEEFLIEYSPDDYSSPDALRAEIKEGLENYIRDKNIKAKVTSVTLLSNDIVGHFFQSKYCPKNVQKMRTFVVDIFEMN